MTWARALNYIQYSIVCPADVHPGRWAAIIKQLEKHGK